MVWGKLFKTDKQLIVLSNVLEQSPHPADRSHFRFHFLVPHFIFSALLFYSLHLSGEIELFLHLLFGRRQSSIHFGDKVKKHRSNFLANQRQRHLEPIQAISEGEGHLSSFSELFYLKFLVFEHQNCSLVGVAATVVGGGEDGDDGWEVGGTIPLVHLVAIELNLVPPDDGSELVLL